MSGSSRAGIVERKPTIPPEEGDSSRGAGAIIKPSATLVFEVELLMIK